MSRWLNHGTWNERLDLASPRREKLLDGGDKCYVGGARNPVPVLECMKQPKRCICGSFIQSNRFNRCPIGFWGILDDFKPGVLQSQYARIFKSNSITL
jgi:hypothetical protein